MRRNELDFIAEVVNGIPLVAECSFLAIDMLDQANKIIRREQRRQKQGPFTFQEAINSGRDWRRWKSDSPVWFRWADVLGGVVVVEDGRWGPLVKIERSWFSGEFELGPEVAHPMAGHIR